MKSNFSKKRLLFFSFLVLVFSLLGCDIFSSTDTPLSTTNPKETAVFEFDNQIISLNIPSDNEKLVVLSATFYSKLSLCESETCVIKDKEIAIHELEILSIELDYEDQIAQIHDQYVILVDAKGALLDVLIADGIYEGTQANYNTEKNAIDYDMQNAYIIYMQKKRSYDLAVAAGATIPSSLRNYASEYQQTISILTAQENELDRLWENAVEYDEILSDAYLLLDEETMLVTELENQRDAEINLVRMEINVIKSE
ncbi:MAG: hypothetical protein WC366_05410 [Bacilli bacterium]|jgi:hypothetical protein